jgi:hypothetical protein
MDLLREKLRAQKHHRACFGGDSSAHSSTTNNDTQVQAAGGDNSTVQSINVTNKGGDVTLTDQGAVKEAFTFAKTAIASAASSSEAMYAGALGTVRDQNKLLADAYQQGQSGDQTQLKYAGFAVVGLAVVATAAFAIKAK